MAKRGRPKKTASEKLSIVLRHRLSKEDMKALRNAAERAGMGLSEYVRQRLFTDEVPKKSN
jgi:hypothetical protein